MSLKAILANVCPLRLAWFLAGIPPTIRVVEANLVAFSCSDELLACVVEHRMFSIALATLRLALAPLPPLVSSTRTRR